MSVLYWILNKIGGWFSILGIIGTIWLGAANETGTFIGCAIAGVFTGALGAFLGGKIWESGVSPVLLFFLSNETIMNHKFVSSVLWFVRFFFIPIIVANIIFIATAG